MSGPSRRLGTETPVLPPDVGFFVARMRARWPAVLATVLGISARLARLDIHPPGKGVRTGPEAKKAAGEHLLLALPLAQTRAFGATPNVAAFFAAARHALSGASAPFAPILPKNLPVARVMHHRISRNNA